MTRDELEAFLKARSIDDAAYADLLSAFTNLTAQIESQKVLETTLQRQNRLLADLQRVTLNMLNRREMPELLQYMVDSASVILDAPYAEILLKQGDRLVVCAVARETEPKLWDAPGPEESQLTWQAFTTGQPVFVDDYQLWPGKRKVFDDIGLHAVAELPILINGACVGVLSLARMTPNMPFTSEEIESCALLLQCIGIVLDNANLYDEALREIAERQRAAQELRLSEERYRTLLSMLAEGVVMYDRDGEILTANPALSPLLGLNIDQMTGREPVPLGWRAFHPDGRPFTDEEYPATVTLCTGQPQTDILMGVQKPDGTVTWLLVNAQPMFAPDDPVPVRVAVSFADVTQRREAEQHALELAAEHKRSAVLSDFIRHASHEFRTPLAIMQTSLYLLTRAKDDNSRAVKMAQIEEQINRIGRLVAMLTEQSMVDSDMQLNIQPLSLNQVIKIAVDSYTEIIQSRELNITYQFDTALPLIRGDADRLSDAIRQLVDNAIRFSPVGGEIVIRTAQTSEMAVLEIRDSGCGIDPQDLPHIFERFYRRDHAHTTPGFGLGLSIADKIIERHAGRIEVESASGEGSLFRIVLPIK